MEGKTERGRRETQKGYNRGKSGLDVRSSKESDKGIWREGGRKPKRVTENRLRQK